MAEEEKFQVFNSRGRFVVTDQPLPNDWSDEKRARYSELATAALAVEATERQLDAAVKAVPVVAASRLAAEKALQDLRPRQTFLQALREVQATEAQDAARYG